MLAICVNVLDIKSCAILQLAHDAQNQFVPAFVCLSSTGLVLCFSSAIVFWNSILDKIALWPNKSHQIKIFTEKGVIESFCLFCLSAIYNWTQAGNLSLPHGLGLIEKGKWNNRATSRKTCWPLSCVLCAPFLGQPQSPFLAAALEKERRTTVQVKGVLVLCDHDVSPITFW